MSSHHVIRDEQEPPVIILTASFNMNLVNELLGWSPLLIVRREVFPFFETSGIKVDHVIGSKTADFSSYGGAPLMEIENLEHFSYPMLLSILEGKSFTGVNIFCTHIMRDNLIENVSLQKSDLAMPLAIFVGEEKTIVSSQKRYSKWYPAGQILAFNDKNISISPSLSKNEGLFMTEVDGKYEFIMHDSLLVITEY